MISYEHEISSNYINGFDPIDAETCIVAVDVLVFVMTCTRNMADGNLINFVYLGCICRAYILWV